MKKFLPLFGVLLLTLVGCSTGEKKVPALRSQAELKPNAGEIIRIDGTAHWLKISGPSIAGDDFEIRVYPRNAWGQEMDGVKVEVTGKLNDSLHTTPPDPSLSPGEYWLSDTKWKLPDAPKK